MDHPINSSRLKYRAPKGDYGLPLQPDDVGAWQEYRNSGVGRKEDTRSKYKKFKVARFITEKGKNADGTDLVPSGKTEIADIISQFGGRKRKTRKSKKKARKSRKNTKKSRKYRKKITKKNKKGGNNNDTGEYIRRSASWAGENQQTNVDKALSIISRKDFDPNGKTSEGEFLVFIALRSKNMGIIEHFIKNPKLEKGFVIEILRSAIANQNKDLIDLIINIIHKENIPRGLLKLAR